VTGVAGFGYAQARLQARLSALPSEPDWERLAAARTLSGFLEEARVGVFADWIKGFSAQSRARDLERGLRRLARERIEETAGWVPESWRPAVLWLAWLSCLPLIEHLARGDPPPDWLLGDEILGWLAEPLDPERAPDAAVLDLLTRSDERSLSVGRRWRRLWIDRWPRLEPGTRERLEALIALVARHLDTFRAARPEDAWSQRLLLRERLRLELHRHPVEPVAVFAYLGLVLLDLERLRAELLRRALFGPEAND